MIMIVSKSSIKNIMLIFSFWLKNKGVVVQATSKDNTKVLFFTLTNEKFFPSSGRSRQMEAYVDDIFEPVLDNGPPVSCVVFPCSLAYNFVF